MLSHQKRYFNLIVILLLCFSGLLMPLSLMRPDNASAQINPASRASTGTSSPTYTVNTGGNQLILSSTGLTGNRTMTFPNATSTLVALSGTAQPTITLAPAANTSIDGFLFADTTAATVGNQQFSPAIVLQGQGWKTTATAGSQDTRWRIENKPVQGTTNPTTTLVESSSINGGAYTARRTLDSGGTETITGDYVGVHLLPSSYLEFQSTNFLNFAPNGTYNDTFNFATHAGSIVGTIQSQKIVAKTSNFTLTTNENNLLMTNTGAAGAVNFTLLTSAPTGTLYRFYIDAAQTFTVTAPASNTIRLGASITASGGNLTASTVGNALTIVCVGANSWAVQAHEGTWTVN